jgi:alanine dehydrogenase
LPFVLAIADRGWRQAMLEDPHLQSGLNVCKGVVTHPAVAGALDLPLNAAELILGNC